VTDRTAVVNLPEVIDFVVKALDVSDLDLVVIEFEVTARVVTAEGDLVVTDDDDPQLG